MYGKEPILICQNIIIAKPRKSEHVFPVPWPFTILWF